jgi:hypothetical protein
MRVCDGLIAVLRGLLALCRAHRPDESDGSTAPSPSIPQSALPKAFVPRCPGWSSPPPFCGACSSPRGAARHCAPPCSGALRRGGRAGRSASAVGEVWLLAGDAGVLQGCAAKALVQKYRLNFLSALISYPPLLPLIAHSLLWVRLETLSLPRAPVLDPTEGAVLLEALTLCFSAVGLAYRAGRRPAG